MKVVGVYVIDRSCGIVFVQVGIYGYTAYSASKFGLRGLAEALQQEVIGDNIHVSLVFPPDTETPGLTEGMEFVWDKVMVCYDILGFPSVG